MPASLSQKFAAIIIAAAAGGFTANAWAADTAIGRPSPISSNPQPYTPPAQFPAAPAPAAPVAPQTAQPYKGVCNSFWVRHEAKIRFAAQMRDVPGNPRLLVKKFTNVQERQDMFGPETYDIDRRYCTATVIMNNGQSYPATYIVARNQGVAAIGGLHVSFCVQGLDNWLIRDNDCRSLRSPNNSVY